MADVRKSLFDLIDATPNLDWLLLTKRPESIRRFWKPRDLETRVQDFGMDRSMFRENVWLGTSVAEQQDAEKNIPELLNCRDLSPVLFVSAEPLVGPVDLIQPMQDADGFLDWVIVGGESGHGARPCDLAWIRSIVKQCKKAGTSVFVKQLGSKPDWNISDSKGGDYSEFPKDLQVREFPK
jgi:protein gp37